MALPGLLQITTDLSRVAVPVSIILLVGMSVKAAFVSSLMAAFHGAGLMSIRGFFGSDDEDDDGGGDGGEEGGMVFDEGVEDMDDDDGLGGFDDMDEGWGDDSGGGGSVGELENRVDELENELASVSSTVSTVKSENEEISDSVDEIEDNVRKLLDIYEMVTRGVNPFVDDAQQGGAFDDGSFGLFDDDDDGGSNQTDEDLDDDIVDAEAESFFDDDFDGEDDFEGGGGGGDPFEEDAAGGDFDDDFEEDAAGGDFDDDFEDGGFDDDPFEDGEEEEDADDDGGGGGTGKSFDELKSEYDSGDAEWAGEGEEPEEGTAEEDEQPDDEAGDDSFETEDDSFETEDDPFGDDDGAEEGFAAEVDASDDAFDDVGSSVDDAFGDADDDPEGGDAVEDTGDPTPQHAPEEDVTEATMTNGTADEDDGEWEKPTEEPSADAMAVPSSERPYLTDLQNGYVADMVVMEWLTYLVEESDAIEAHRAVKYYEDVEWISEGVADRLWNFLDGFPHDGPEDVLPPREDMSYPSELTVDHHIRSLSYIANLAGDQQRELFDRWNHRGEPNAIQH